MSNRKGFPCTELTFKLTIINRSPCVQENLKIRDTFPPEMRIKAIKRNPFDSRLLSGTGSNILAIDGIRMPIGEESIEVILEIPEGTPLGNYSNQAVLKNVQSKLTNNDIRISDDALSPAANDPTLFEISDLEVTFGCPASYNDTTGAMTFHDAKFVNHGRRNLMNIHTSRK